MRIIRLKELMQKISLGSSKIYDMLKTDKDFPKPIKLGRTVGWIEHEVDNWIQLQIDLRESR